LSATALKLETTMPKAPPITTYDTVAFREKYIESKQLVNTLLKPGFDKFFIVPVQDMIRLMKLPVPPVRTNTHTLIFLTEGEGIMNIGSDTYTVLANECLIVPAGQVFSFNNVDLNKGYLCNFHQDLITTLAGQKAWLRDMEFLQVWANPRIILDQQTAGFVQNLLHRLLTAYTQQGITDKPLIQSYLLALLCEINRVAQPVVKTAETQATQIARKFRTLVHTHFKTKHRVADYAALLHISPNHLNKSVKAATTKSPSRWIDEAIVLEAKVLLYQSHRAISDIATEVGLQDPSYFSRLFKKYEGITPQTFRKRIEKS
jgi:AraC family transcriptional regulator, transcriptional activator of pobA